MGGRSDDDNALLEELGIETEVKKVVAHTPKEERIISGFEEIQKFIEDNGRLPEHGEDKDIFERLYACLLYTSPSPRDATLSRMPSSA